MTTKAMPPEVMLYTFACCPEDPGVGSYGARLIFGTHQKEFVVAYRQTTLERLAIMAVIAGLEVMKTSCRITLYTNLASIASIVRSGRLERWQQSGWQQGRQAIVHADLWQELWHLCTLHELHCAEILVRDDLSVLVALGDLADAKLQRDNWAIDAPFEANSGFSVSTMPVETPSSSPAEMRADLRLAQPPPDQTFWRNGDTVYLRHEDQSYLWDGHEWCDSNYITLPSSLSATLNTRLADYLATEDRLIDDVEELLERAIYARDAQQYQRSESLARRVLTKVPGNPPALAVLCATLRARGKPQQALDETADSVRLSYPPLLNSRAAALCDVGQWAEAKRVVGRSLAIQKSEEAFAVVRRIKAAFPELYW